MTVKLEDLVLNKHTATCSFGEIEVRGLGIGDIAVLLVKFPALSKLANGESGSMNVASLVSEVAPSAIPAIVASACGMSGKKGEEKAKNLPITDQLRILAKAAELTFPGGLEAFLAEVEALVPADLNKKSAPSISTPADLLETPPLDWVR